MLPNQAGSTQHRTSNELFTLAGPLWQAGSNAARHMQSTQDEFDFTGSGSEDGHSKWLEGRQMAARELARRIGLPLGHEVEVWLYGGIRLKGHLRLKEEMLFVEADKIRHMELMVDHVGFTYREMESCVRLD
jgi:hypothetical protein